MENFYAFKKTLYNEYQKQGGELGFEDFFDLVTQYKDKEDKFVVYVAYNKKSKETDSKIIYVGTTTQYPLSRFVYHKLHGKDFRFEIVCRFDNEKDMLDKEFELIQKYKPRYNKRIKAPQNYNVPLSQEELDLRKGNPEWCQCCLRRRVSKGYERCYYCSR